MYKNLQEEPLKNKIKADFFPENTFDYTQVDNIDFVIAKKTQESDENTEYFLWAEAKKGKRDILESFVQLILTIGKAKTFEEHMPPKYLGAFDAEKFAFIEYHKVQELFSRNDINWKVTPSNHKTKEFEQLLKIFKQIIERDSLVFHVFQYETDSDELKKFIKDNFKVLDAPTRKIVITKNNFVFVYQKWVKSVQKFIDVNWEEAQKSGILPSEFFLADLLSENNFSLKDELYVSLKGTKYELDRILDKTGIFLTPTAGFTDNQKAYNSFWAIYERPPKEEYWGYIIEHRHLIVPQDYREIKGAFYTPETWVVKSQEYLANVLGENWQDEYYIWDCCAGTGNMLNGLINKRNTWASTLDKADVDVMLSRVKDGNLPMFEDHIFQFDFLNDDFSKCPEELQEIIKDPKKREKLVIYINPPYAEAANARTITGTGQNKKDVAVKQKTYEKYFSSIGIAGRELFAQFFIRIYFEIPNCILGEFSTLKILQAPTFQQFRNVFKAKLLKMFVVSSKTFDNTCSVKGFPIGFMIWDLKEKEVFSEIEGDVFEKERDKVSFLKRRKFKTIEDFPSLTDWIKETRNRAGEKEIGYMSAKGSDFQNINYNYIVNQKSQLPHPRGSKVTTKNILETGVYFAVRHCIEHTWLNDRDQFFYPNDNWKKDAEFHSDCLIFTLFDQQNNISAEKGINHWIPFTEEQIGCRKSFKSHFMSDFLIGKAQKEEEKQGSLDIFKKKEPVLSKIIFSEESKAVYEAGLELWKYYHSQKNANPDASYYDIRKYFKGTYITEKGEEKMNNTSTDEKYTELNNALSQKMKILADKIAEKVYKYGFLK